MKRTMMGLFGHIPLVPGWFFWSEWDTAALVYKKKGGKHLYVKPPCTPAIEVRVTPRLCGDFKYIADACPTCKQVVPNE